MELWRQVWRRAILPRLKRAGLVALRDALAGNDPKLLQGFTTAPPPLDAFLDCPIEGACPVTLALWFGEGLKVVGEASVAFGLLRAELGRPTALDPEPVNASAFFDWWDNQPRAVVVPRLLEEVRLGLAEMPI